MLIVTESARGAVWEGRRLSTGKRPNLQGAKIGQNALKEKYANDKSTDRQTLNNYDSRKKRKRKKKKKQKKNVQLQMKKWTNL